LRLLCYSVSSFLLSSSCALCFFFPFFFLQSPAPTGLYTLSLHDALPIFRPDSSMSPWSASRSPLIAANRLLLPQPLRPITPTRQDRKSTRLNSSHVKISYAVFCLKKKKKHKNINKQTNQQLSTQTHTQSA